MIICFILFYLKHGLELNKIAYKILEGGSGRKNVWFFLTLRSSIIVVAGLAGHNGYICIWLPFSQAQRCEVLI